MHQLGNNFTKTYTNINNINNTLLITHLLGAINLNTDFWDKYHEAPGH